MDKLQSIKVFIEVAKCQSFSEAALTLNMSAPAVTRAVAALEDRLRVKLLNRTTRLVRLTAPGLRFLHDAENILESLNEAECAASGVYSKPAGTLTVTAPVLFGQKYIMPIIQEYLDTYPDVRVKAVFFDRVTSLLEEELDVAIRIGYLKDSSLYATQVGQVRRVVCASPRYFIHKGVPMHPSDLADHDIIYPETYESRPEWKFQHQGVIETVKLEPRLSCNQNAAALKAALDGYGITRLMSYQVAQELANGTLQDVLTSYEGEPLPVSILHIEGRRTNAKIRTFIDLAAARLKKSLIF
ncbi:LysR family transcriptional regulator [Psychromonas sp. MME2]|uniref:LysR family transcriptional regulator n=1 Tax=unclassified Psychromonas TaxID=2614957 RepID=UPI00339D0859